MDCGGPVIAVDIGGNISSGPPDTFPETGVYFPSDGSVTRLFSKEPVLTTKTTVKKIDEEFLPEDILNVKNEITNKLDRANPNAFGSFSMGRTYPSVIGTNSCATGASIIASGNYSHAEGADTTASGNYSHAEGYMATASNNSSHAEGYNTTASADISHAEGANTTASGISSHAEGDHTIASGVNSHAEGHATKASSAAQHVQGVYNIEDPSDTYAHIVGNGTLDTARSNAHTLDWSGNAWYAGTVEGKALILSSTTEGSTKKFKITVDDSGTLTATEVK